MTPNRSVPLYVDADGTPHDVAPHDAEEVWLEARFHAVSNVRELMLLLHAQWAYEFKAVPCRGLYGRKRDGHYVASVSSKWGGAVECVPEPMLGDRALWQELALRVDRRGDQLKTQG